MLPSAEHTFGQEKLASMTCAPASTAHSAHWQKSLIISFRPQPSCGVATIETTRIWPGARDCLATLMSSRQISGAMDGMPKHTAELMCSGFPEGWSVG